MELSENAKEIVRKRYNEKETWQQLSDRVGFNIASCEKDHEKWNSIFSEMLYNLDFIAAGRVLRNAGKIRQSMLNCGALQLSDSMESIFDTLRDAAMMWKYGAGIGIDFSPLRDEGRELVTFGGVSSGMLSFMDVYDVAANKIETGGQRRSGCLGMCSVSHPEIFSFVRAKSVEERFKRFNLSVAVNTNFLNSVENDADWDLSFAGKVVRTIKAREIWNEILNCMIKHAEPGLINYNNLVKNNSYYFNGGITCTNLCGELPLAAYEMCDLGSINLSNFIINRNTNWKRLEATIYNAVRFLDNVLDVNFYPIPKTELATKNGRKIGLGVMGLHDYLIKKEIIYGSEKSLQEIEKLFIFIRNVAYESSIKLAEEKGPFPKYSKNEYCHTSYIRKLPAKIRMKIKEKSIRNCTILSCAPTGTISLIPEVSSGIEPIYAFAYKRKDRVSERVYIHKALQNYIESGNKEKPEWMVDAHDLSPQDHLEMQVIIQKYIDNSVSKTINCPKNITVKELSGLLLEYIYDLKGVTVYVDGSRKEQVLNRMTFDQAVKHVNKEKEINGMSVEDVQCGKGGCEI